MTAGHKRNDAHTLHDGEHRLSRDDKKRIRPLMEEHQRIKDMLRAAGASPVHGAVATGPGDPFHTSIRYAAGGHAWQLLLHNRDEDVAFRIVPRAEISSFTGPYAFLGSFWACRVTLHAGLAGEAITGPSAEHVFQAAKVTTAECRQRVLSAPTAGEAKRRGRETALRPGWDQMRKQVMFEIVLAKFTQHPGLAAKLAATGPARLTEGNTWGDTYWGACDGDGENWLGRILEMVRDLIS